MFDMRIEFSFGLFTIDADELGDDRVSESESRMGRQRTHRIRRDELFARCKDRNEGCRTDAMHYIPAAVLYRLCTEIVSQVKSIELRQPWHGWRAGHMALIDGPPQLFTPQAVQTDRTLHLQQPKILFRLAKTFFLMFANATDDSVVPRLGPVFS